jgi:hypothetical protein
VKFLASSHPKAVQRFCAFMAGSCDKSIYPADAALRAAFFDVLGERYQPCEAIGRCRREGSVTQPGTRRSDREGSAVSLLRPFRFVLSFENMFMPGTLAVARSRLLGSFLWYRPGLCQCRFR